MKKYYLLFTFVLGIMFFSSCDLLEQAAEDTTPTEEDIVKGLKTALTVGTDTSVVVLHAADGYYKDKVVKILLPEEAQVVLQYVNYLPAEVGTAVEGLVEKINRSAEDAASEAKPIFVNAITDMTIEDGINILKGVNVAAKGSTDFDSTAATHYLEFKTRTGLTALFAPKISTSLNKPIVAGVSAQSSWDYVFTNYNKFANTLPGQIAGATPVNTDLPTYATEKALDGLFYKVGIEEKKIRKDPYQWALDILHKIFDSVYVKG